MDRLDALRAFTRVVDLGGFAAAARELGVARSTVHKAVVSLENGLGTQLLRRSTRQVSPTDSGLAFYDRSVGILAELEQAMAAVSDLQEQPRGRLRVNAPMSFGTMHLSKVTADFMTEYPDVRIELMLSDRFVDTIEEGFDVTVRISAARYPTSLICRRLVAAKRAICASPVYLRAHGEPESPRDLRDHVCLQYGYLESGNSWKLSGPRGDESVQIHCGMWSNNGEVLRDAAVRDRGIALLPTFVIGSELQAGTLCTVLTDYCPPDVSVQALYPRHRHLSASVRVFVEHLTRHFAGRPYWDLVQ